MAEALPIVEVKKQVDRALRDNAVNSLILKAPTGSGKSTQVPQWVMDWQREQKKPLRVVVLQPRRMAARWLANRVAKECCSVLGKKVGYQIKGEHRVGAETELVFVTEGLLLRQMMQDPCLKNIGCVILDEFHERHVDGDVCLSWLRAVQKTERPDLKLIVMSATLEEGSLKEFLGQTEVIESAGRMYPVEIRYQSALAAVQHQAEPIWEQAKRAAESLLQQKAVDGDVLIFMPGRYEIFKTMTALQQVRGIDTQQLFALHGEMSPAEQDKVMQVGEQPKWIVSTNVAETSLTIPGVTTVIDSGLVRRAVMDVGRGINTLHIEKISRASADQRAGRAGRVQAGRAIRLWSEREHYIRPTAEIAEIARIELSEVLLSLAVVKEQLQLDWRWFEDPPEASILRADQLLKSLHAIDEKGNITTTGRQMARYPLHPRLARVLVAAMEGGVVQRICRWVALAAGRTIFLKNDTADENRELWTEREHVSEFEAMEIALTKAESVGWDPQACGRLGLHAGACKEVMADAQQYEMLVTKAREMKTESTDKAINGEMSAEQCAKAMLTGFLDHLGVETSTGSRIYRLAGEFSGHLPAKRYERSPRWLVATEVIEVKGKKLQVVLGGTLKVEENWLRELYAEDFQIKVIHRYDEQQRRVQRCEVVKFQKLILNQQERGEPDLTAAAEILARKIADGTLELKQWNETVDQWLLRLKCLAQWMPELELQPLEDDDRLLILNEVCMGSVTYKQVKDAPVMQHVKKWLNQQQRQWLEEYAPEQVTLSNGRTLKVQYQEGLPPFVACQLQRLYDVEDVPKLAGGKVTPHVQLLSPAQRPIQTTSDLKRFWQESYPAVKKELKGRYPKHEWR
jgi:ATP-dependent helicase HrpB